jgi:pimeloyl-ACP methyl ester carboxylesterase
LRLSISIYLKTNFLQVVVGGADTVCFVRMHQLGFQHHRLKLSRSLSSFPFRILAPLYRNLSPAKNLSYWFRPHTSKTRLPVLFIHGIGIGLQTYAEFLGHLTEEDAERAKDDQVGIIALEIMPICFRITHMPLPRDEMVAQILRILQNHDWDRFVLVAHSYGTIIATYLLHSLSIGPKVGPVVLIDPVNLSMHMGDICYNFVYRQPRKASEWQLHYFACTDIGVAHTITRSFMWTENTLWKEEIKGRRVTVVLAAQDIIVDTKALRRYLIAEFPRDDERQSINDWEERNWRGDGLDILWYPELNHAQVFDTTKDRRGVVGAIQSYCQISQTPIE